MTIDDAGGRAGDAARPARCSSASAARRAPAGPPSTACAPTAAGYILTGPDLLEDGRGRTAGRSTATRSRSRRACRACSPPATCATARPSASAGAVGEGAMAVALAHRRLEELRAGS